MRPDELIPQLDVRRDPRHLDVAGSAWLILGGLFKKVVVSSFLATTMVDPVFGDPAAHSAIDAIFGILAYAIVIYADFSGYTDIAIGVAKLLGFQFPQNFDRPYSARSLQDFWRRWHITLSRWLRDYLYIPLGGSKQGEVRTYVNIVADDGARRVSGTAPRGRSCSGGCTTAIGQAIGAWKRTHLPARPETPMLVWGQRARDVRARLRRLGVLPRRLDGDRVHVARPAGRRLDDADRGGHAARASARSPSCSPCSTRRASRDPGLQERSRGGVRCRWASRSPPPLFVIATLGPQGVAPFIYFQF